MPYKNLADRRAWRRRNAAMVREHAERYKIRLNNRCACGALIRPGTKRCAACYIAQFPPKPKAIAFAYCDRCGRSRPAAQSWCMHKPCRDATRIEKRKAYERARSKSHNLAKMKSPTHRIGMAVRGSIRAAILRRKIWGKKNGRTFACLGYTPSDLRLHIENLFTFGMTWDNYGDWHIDHIRPASWFNIKAHGDSECVRCWSLWNLQPRWRTTAIALAHGVYQEGNQNKAARYAG